MTAYPHAPTPAPLRRTNTCNRCGCAWALPSPVEALCRRPVAWHPKGCLCHSRPWAAAWLDERDRAAEERLMTI